MRSGGVALGVVGALALSLTSCDSSPDERCVDTTNYKTVADKYCDNTPGRGWADTDRYQWYESGSSSTSHVGGYHRSYRGSGSRGGTGSNDGTGHGVTRGGLGGHGSGSHGG
ncbi:hypothetical protein [Streptacidiphilus rugosus]|uniref:hypothetical protein n=1 Tax=Streptacidiphilus rugosus TaxID=405783 RepID=UPI0006896348|nr:hypothetical protein [Streptacidiphilus rugosus]